MKWVLLARDEFERFKVIDPATLTDIQRAVRFYFLMKLGFGARVTNPSFGIGATQKPRLNLLRIEEDLSTAHLRLSRVFIENKPYERVIERFDRPETFFYIDPPYFGCENYYGKGLFAREDFAKLRDQLAKAKGKWLMSINDVPEIRELFAAFEIREVVTSYSVSAGARKPVTELLIANYKLPPRPASRKDATVSK